MVIRLTAIPAISSTILCQKYTTYCEYGNQAYSHIKEFGSTGFCVGTY